MLLQDIDVNFDFTSDTPGFWDGFWAEDRRSGVGYCGAGPDTHEVKLWYGDIPFEGPVRPQTIDEYLAWVQSQLDFVASRNARIKADIAHRIKAG